MIDFKIEWYPGWGVVNQANRLYDPSDRRWSVGSPRKALLQRNDFVFCVSAVILRLVVIDTPEYQNHWESAYSQTDTATCFNDDVTR